MYCVACQIDTKLEEFKSRVNADNIEISSLDDKLEASMLSRRHMLEDLFEAEELLHNLVSSVPLLKASHSYKC